MKRYSFKMKLYPGYREEYKKRHRALWPELEALLTETGIVEYSFGWMRKRIFCLQRKNYPIALILPNYLTIP